jgi:hypothetical protein
VQAARISAPTKKDVKSAILSEVRIGLPPFDLGFSSPLKSNSLSAHVAAAFRALETIFGAARHLLVIRNLLAALAAGITKLRACSANRGMLWSMAQ